MIDNRMKRCPFCGSDVEVFKRASAHEQSAYCSGCNIDFFFNVDDRNEAIAKWNRRA